jgi:hypothetical protein
MSGQRQRNNKIHRKWRLYCTHAEWLQCFDFIEGEETSGASRDNLECQWKILECLQEAVEEQYRWLISG